jgi:hypothetical protein
MAKNARRIAEKLGAQSKGKVPDVGGGAFAMARLARILAERLQPGQGRRPGRPSDPTWVEQGKVPMSEETKRRLTTLATTISREGRQVSPMQVAAQLLEERLAQLSHDKR